MKKFFAVICSIFLFALPFAATGCNSGWQEVQSISYVLDESGYIHTVESIYSWNIASEPIDEEEYTNAPSESICGKASFMGTFTLPTNRSEAIKRLNNAIGKTYYTEVGELEKFTITGYKIDYVKVKISGKTIEIDYNDRIEEITPVSYKITYFEN